MARLAGGRLAHAFQDAWTDWAHHLGHSPGGLRELAEHARQNAQKLTTLATRGGPGAALPTTSKPNEIRFHQLGWDGPPFLHWQRAFLAIRDWWHNATDHLRGLRAEDADRVRFRARQVLDPASPRDLPTLNPEIIQTFLASGEPTTHFTQDLVKILTQTRGPKPKGSRVGKDLTCTPGSVVFHNDLFELIQYGPQTAKVRAEPIRIAPVWIMGHCILDPSPHDSKVNYSVGQGITDFMISWSYSTSEWALNVILLDSKAHVGGPCLAGTTPAIAAATMARDSEYRLTAITLLAAQVDFAEARGLLLFVDESQLAFPKTRCGSGLSRPPPDGAYLVLQT